MEAPTSLAETPLYVRPLNMTINPEFALLEVLERRNASAVTRAVSKALNNMRKGGKIHTMTWDNGKEFAQA